MRVWVQRLAGRRWELEVPEAVEVVELRRLVAQAGGLPIERLKLVLNAKPLQDGERPPKLTADDTLVAVLAPLAPTAEFSRMAAGTSAVEYDTDDDEGEGFKLRRDAGRLERRLASYLQHQMKLPPLALSAIFLVRPVVYLYILLWLACCPIAAKFEVGPVYVLGTMIAVIFVNLGKRKAGEASAYSVFNQGRELPGQLNAGAIDDQMRRGQM